MLLSVEETPAYEPCTNIYQNRSLFFTFFFFIFWVTKPNTLQFATANDTLEH